MFEGRAVLYRTIRTLARTIERERARQMAGPQFDAWLDEHCYTGRDLPQGTRSKTIAWSAAEAWPGSIEWYVLDDSVIGAPEHGCLFYEIPFADLELMPQLPEFRPLSRRRRHAGDRYLATRAALHELAAQAETEGDRVRWVKIELALVLAEATGRRLGSIRQLRWEDVDWNAGTIRWRAEADKKRREAIVPVPVRLLDELRRFQRELRAVAGLVFGAEHDATKAMDRHLFDKWLAHAEKKAGLKKLDGGLWHPYRRKWATERKHLSITDVAEAGGWKDTVTLLTCYARSDNETLLAVMSEERKLRDCAVGARNGPPTGPR
jgi:integrase